MKKMLLIMLLAVGVTAFGQGTAGTLKISSPDFADGGNIPARFTRDGENVNPSLQISGVPANAKSLVLIVDDPDAPAGTWTHWLIWNLKPDPAGALNIATNSVPAGGVQGANDFHKSVYGGPAPPSGTHRYFFRIYVLDTALDLPAGSNRKALDKAMSGHVLAQAEWMGKYARVK